jgi:beta-lactamase superfamily II metal-dependent hydrolase
MLFTLEALEAKHGDALLLHYGTRANPRLVVIDGGPAGVYSKTLKPRLRTLRDRRSPGKRLEIDLLMVSHIDDDHINGVLALVEDLAELRKAGEELPFDIRTLWHNSFEELTAGDTASLALPAGDVSAAAVGDAPPAGLPLSRRGALIVLSVGQGQSLRNQANFLGLSMPKLVVYGGGQARKRNVVGDLTLQVLGPNEKRVVKLREEWLKELEKKARTGAADFQASAAAFVDNSVANLSSIVVLVRQGERTILLTGDARGDDILDALTEAELLTNEHIHVDLLKMPHHGSDRNVTTDFFRKVTADHYLISADGRFGNPEIKTLDMIAEARGDAPYTVYLTNSIPRVDEHVEKQKGKKAKFVIRGAADASIRVDLGEALDD